MPATLEALIIVLVFLVPGYVATVAFTRNAPRGEISDLRFLLQVAFWGAVTDAVLLFVNQQFLFFFLQDLRDLFAFATPDALLRGGIAFLLFPAVVASLTRRLIDVDIVQTALRAIGLSHRDRAPTAWDAAFAPGRPGAWVYVYVRGQSDPIIGELGIGSIAGVSPYEHDLFLKRRYEPSSVGPPTPVSMNEGVWISADAIELVEFFNAGGEGSAEIRGQDSQAGN